MQRYGVKIQYLLENYPVNLAFYFIFHVLYVAQRFKENSLYYNFRGKKDIN